MIDRIIAWSIRRRFVVLAAREGSWELYDPHVSKDPIGLRYSEKDSESIRLDYLSRMDERCQVIGSMVRVRTQ